MKIIARIFAGPVMVLAGLNHFFNPDFYLRIIPPVLPAPEFLNLASGAAEVLGGLGTLHPRTRRPAGWLLIATLVGIFPANVYMALNASDYPDVPGGQAGLIARLPLQVLFIYWVWLAALKDERQPA
jgi:uncharacterized membrane protein